MLLKFFIFIFVYFITFFFLNYYYMGWDLGIYIILVYISREVKCIINNKLMLNFVIEKI